MEKKQTFSVHTERDVKLTVEDIDDIMVATGGMSRLPAAAPWFSTTSRTSTRSGSWIWRSS